MKTLSHLLALGLSVLLYTAEKDDVSDEPGPARARLFKAPYRPGAIAVVASQPTIEEALEDLLTVDDATIALVGTMPKPGGPFRLPETVSPSREGPIR